MIALPRLRLISVCAAWRVAAFVALAGAAVSVPVTAAVEIDSVTYHGWTDAVRLRNAQIEVIVVPQIARVMSLRFRDGENLLWNDRFLDGRRGDPDSPTWINFGGDKTWPAPEDEWGAHTRRTRWLPPPGFDSLPASVTIEGDVVTLTHQVDPFFAIRAARRITLQPDAAVLEITTAYERVSGPPSRVGIWIITQLVDPVAIYVPVPEHSQFPDGYYVFRDKTWPEISRRGDLIRITRDPATNHKMGSDADRMLWVGEKAMCLVSAPRIPGAEYPDRGASAEVYTNKDPKRYIELETLGPLVTLAAGERIRHSTTYQLLRRSDADPEADARRALGL